MRKKTVTKGPRDVLSSVEDTERSTCDTEAGTEVQRPLGNMIGDSGGKAIIPKCEGDVDLRLRGSRVDSLGSLSSRFQGQFLFRVP